MKAPRILTLSISTGHGHHVIGRTLEEEFRARGALTNFVDAYEYTSPMLSKFISKGYLASVAYAPNFLASKAYDLVVKKDTPSGKASVVHLTNVALARKLKKYIAAFDPDIIICTHVLSAMLAEIVQAREWTDALTCGIVTDFTVHPMWQNARTLDYIVTPSELLDYQAVKKGIAKEKILPFGIPIEKKFTARANKKAICADFGLSEKSHKVLIMGGSMGHGKIADAIKKLDTLDIDLEIIAVFGNNKKAYEKVVELEFKKKVKAIAWTDRVHDLMEIASCVLTKPGGRTIAEALAKGLPIIMQNPIAGHEERNVEFLQNNGLAFNVTKTFPVEEAVYSMLKNEERLNMMKAVVRLFARPNASRDICDKLLGELDESIGATISRPCDERPPRAGRKKPSPAKTERYSGGRWIANGLGVQLSARPAGAASEKHITQTRARGKS